MANTRASRVRRRPDLAFRRIDEETWIVCPRHSTLHRLNGTGARLWELLEGEPTILALGEALAREFEVEPERAAADAEAFVRTLAERGLVDLVPEESLRG